MNDFKPTFDQEEFVLAYLLEDRNITQAMGKLGIDRKVYYAWRKQPGFDEWLSDALRKEVIAHWGEWYGIAQKFAEKGSYQHLQLLFELAERYIPSVKVIEEISDDKLIELARKKGLTLPSRVERFLAGQSTN